MKLETGVVCSFPAASNKITIMLDTGVVCSFCVGRKLHNWLLQTLCIKCFLFLVIHEEKKVSYFITHIDNEWWSIFKVNEMQTSVPQLLSLPLHSFHLLCYNIFQCVCTSSNAADNRLVPQ